MDSQHTVKVKSVYYNINTGDKMVISVNIASNDDISKSVLNDFSNFLYNYKINGYIDEDERNEIIEMEKGMEKEIKLKEKEIKLKEKEDKKKSKKTKVKIDF